MNNKNNRSIFPAFLKAVKGFRTAIPVLLAVILLLGIFRTFVSEKMIASVFTGDLIKDTLLGSIIGSISAGNPINSYVIGGELLKNNVSLFAVTAFIAAWVTVGIVQLPAEAMILGKRFAISRNILSFILSILVSIATVITLKLIL
jgi:uncharacterized membrane protein YraQ (UPF0718 family)